jgi:hypothetical protein
MTRSVTACLFALGRMTPSHAWSATLEAKAAPASAGGSGPRGALAPIEKQR